MRRPSRSLARRVVWAVTGAVAVFLGMLAIVAYSVLAQQEDVLVNEMLIRESQRLVHRLQTGETSVPQNGSLRLGPGMQAWVGDSAAQRDGLPASLRGLPAGLHELHTDDSVWHLAVTDAPAGRVQVLYEATPHEERVYDFGKLLLALWAVGSLFGYTIARTIAGRVVAPLHELTERLASWGEGLPRTEAQDDTYQDEAGRLLEAFNRVQDQVDRALATEREFAMNLSHEIRTPLTAIRTDAELTGLGSNLTPAQVDRLQRIMRTVDEVGETISSVHAMTTDHAGPKEVAVVAQVIDDVWAGLADRAEAAGLSFLNAIPENLMVRLDRQALVTVSRNLIVNAIEHAAPARLVVEAVPEGIRFADNGPGIAPDDLPFVFERYYRGLRRDASGDDQPGLPASPRRGLGLAIARRTCLLQGWQIDVEASISGPDKGTTFTVLIPAFDAATTSI